jgi:hypothetical protein
LGNNNREPHYAYACYKEVFGGLSGAQEELLIQQVTEKRITERAWRDALENWKLCGYSPRNLAGMIEYANARPAGNVGPVIRRQDSIADADAGEPDIPTVVVRVKRKVFEWEA